MAMNKKGQVIFFGIMVAVMAFILLTQIIPVLKSNISTQRDSSHLDCSNSSITTGNKATCVIVDMQMFYFFGAAMAAAIGYIFYRRSSSQE